MMVRGRLTKTVADGSRPHQNPNVVSRMKTRLASSQRKLHKDDQQCITKFFEISQIKLVKSECDSAIQSNKVYQQDFFESRYTDIIIASFEKPSKIQKTEEVSLPGSPLHRIQLNSEVAEIRPKLTKSRPNNCSDRQLTEFFPIRRSERKTKKIVQEEKQKSLEEQLRSDIEAGLTVQTFNGKGRGVIATKPFNRGDFVVEYSGELLDMVQAKQREDKYAHDTNTGCYMYYFKYQNHQFCIDATAETGRLGRLINHSRNGNLITRTVVIDTLPRLVFIAKDFINIGDELSYDYGDRSKESLKHHPWLAL